MDAVVRGCDVGLLAGEAGRQVDGFDALYSQHVTHAMQLAGLLCGSREQAEDAVAEAFSRVLPRWRAGAVEAFWPYLRIAVVNQLRGQARRDATELRRAPNASAPQSTPPEDERVAERSRLAAALGELPAAQRHAVVLRYFEDLSEAEAAALLGCSVGTVKSNASRGVARLRTLLADGEVSDDR